MKRLGVLTGGGDCPGLNGVIRAVVREATRLGHGVWGIRNGWLGLVQGVIEPLSLQHVAGILPKGGTILGTSRTNPYKDPQELEQLLEHLGAAGLDAIVAIGGEDTLGVAERLWRERSLPVVGVPKTIDNDVAGTDYTFGFHTAVQIVADNLDRLQTTAESHQRTIVVEVMGRDAGWIALYAGIAGGADGILIPEKPFSSENVAAFVNRRRARNKSFSVIVIAEGARPVDMDAPGGAMDAPGGAVDEAVLSARGLDRESDRARGFEAQGIHFPGPKGGACPPEHLLDEFGHVRLGGIGPLLARQLEQATGIETRCVVLGHIQRGGTPTAFDRVLATRMGVAAVRLLHGGRYGRMVALQGTRLTDIALSDAIGRPKRVDLDDYPATDVIIG